MAIATATLAAVATIASAAASVYSAVSSKKDKAPEVPKLTPPPQEAKTPDADVFKTRNARAGAGPGAANSTLLTGMGGVPASAVNLGKNTLLGA